MSKLQEFEQKLKTLIENPPLKPKYELWQEIHYSCSLNPKDSRLAKGRIVGFYYMSVGIGYQDNSEPGWYYFIESGFSHSILHEESIVGGNE